MRIIQTKEYIKRAYISVDDQPGYIHRDVLDQGDTILLDSSPESKEEIIKNWNRRRRRRILDKMPQGSL